MENTVQLVEDSSPPKKSLSTHCDMLCAGVVAGDSFRHGGDSGSARKPLYSQGLQDHAVTKAGLVVFKRKGCVF